MSDKKPGTNPLLARYKSTVDYFYKGIPDTDKEIQGDSILLKRKGQNSKGDSESSVEKKNRLENDDRVSVSRESNVDGSSVSSTSIKGSVSKKCHDGKDGNLEKEENKLIILNKRGDSFSSAGKKTFLEENDGGLRTVSQENGMDRNKISSVNVKKTNEEPENKRQKLIKTGDMAGSVEEKIFGEKNSKSSFSRESSLDESSADHKTSSIMKISYNEKEGKLEMVVEELTSASNKRDSVCPPDKEDGLRSVSQEGSVINANIMTEKLEKEAEKSTSARKKESALKRKENYVKMTTTIEKFMERDIATKKTSKVFICDVCRASFSLAEIKHHRKFCPSVVVKRLTEPELASWLSFSPRKTKVILERLKENDIKFWSSAAHKVHDVGISSLGQRCAKDSLHRPKSSSLAKMCSEKQHCQVVNSLEQEKEKEQENISASDNRYVCGKCRMTFPDVSNLKLHLLNHLTGPEELKLSTEIEELDEPLAKSNLCSPIPQENSPPMIATGLKTQIISRGSQTQIISPGLQSQIMSSAPTIRMNPSNPNNHESSPETNKNLANTKVKPNMNPSNPNNHESSPETNKNLANTKVKPNMNSSGSKPFSILLKNKTSVKKTSDSQTIPACVTQDMNTQTTARLNLQTNAVIQENNVKLPAEVAKNNSWSTQETVALPIKQEVDDSLRACYQTFNLKPTWMSNNLQTTDSSRSVDVSLTRGTNQVLDRDRQFTNHISHSSDLPPSTVRVTPDVRIQGGSNSKASSDLCYFTNILTRDDHVSSGEGSVSTTTGTGSASVVGSPVPNKSSLIVSWSLFSRGKTIPSTSKSPSTIQNSATVFPSSSPTAKSLQTLRDKFKNSHQAIVNQLPVKKTGPGQKSLSQKSQKSQQDFKCSICSTKLRTADELKKHEVVHTLSSKLKDIVSRVKKAEEFVCGLCKKPFVKEEQLKIHVRCAHRSQNNPVSSSQEQAEEFVCGVCKQIFDTDNDLKTHITTVHRIKIADSEENEVFYCGLCNKSFQTSSELENHMPVHTVDKFVCGICNQPFIQSKHLIEHMGSHAGTSAL